ncbi:MAG: alpha/beta hydrolase [Polyangiales bacterium]
MRTLALAAAVFASSGCAPLGEIGSEGEQPSADAIATFDTAVADTTATEAAVDETRVTEVAPDDGVTDPGTEGDGDHTIGPTYVKAPELTVASGTPRGKVYHFTMSSSDSAIFPGVTGPYTRDLWAYVPKQYVNGHAAPLMIVQDGGGYVARVTAAMDSLIDQKKLPAIVVVFANPGPGDGRGSERGFEYDTVSPAYTQFIETEVLPRVRTLPELSADDDDLRFTTNPDGRASMGCSSGGAAAFTMGWFRPDLYRRILTYSGTFVNQAPDTTHPHSAWEYHEHLIAETATKPLRVFLEVGENDLNLDGSFKDGMHDWVAANQAMAKSLAAPEYHHRFLFAKGANHCDGRVIEQTLPETLLWLWRGYPIDG